MTDEGSAALNAALEHLVEFARDHALELLVVVIGLLAVQSVRLYWLRTAAGRRMKAHRSLGAKGERRARGLLEAHGYEITGEQVGGSYEIFVDDKTCPVRLRADFVVKKGGKTYVAEVKAGVESVKISGRTTRRQLLEYLFAFDVNGVLLVNMQQKRIFAIGFPSLKGR